MITIHFSQCFDDGVGLCKNIEEQTAVNISYQGPMGLLGFLERELGLTGVYSTAFDRASKFAAALEKHLTEAPDVFYADAFKSDEMGVSRDLLNWRDNLVWLGWKKIPNDDQPQRLKTLALVELHFIDRHFHYGVADRWQDVIKSLIINKKHIQIKLVIYDDPVLVHPFFKKLFVQLEKCIEFKDQNENIIIDDDNLGRVKKLLLGKKPEADVLQQLSEDISFSILRLKDNHLAADLLANQIKQGFNPMVINGENKILDYYLLANGLPTSGSTLTNSNPLIIQLFKLVLVVLITPINVYNLLSLLQSPYSPIPKKLSRVLARQLIEKPGVDGIQWKDTIRNYFADLQQDDPENRLLQKKKEEITLFLSFNSEPTIDVPRIKNLYGSLKGWADKHSLSGIFEHTEEERDQFAWLSELTGALLQKIHDETEPYTGNRLLKLVESIYEPASFPNEVVQSGSVQRVGSPGCLLGNPALIWWQDCYNSTIRAKQHSFLYSDEIDFLHQYGIETWLPENQVKMAYGKLKRGILAATSQCILVVVEKYNGEDTTTHPVISEIGAGFKNINQVMATFREIELLTNFGMQVSHTEKINLPLANTRWKISNPEKLSKRKTESASSIEKLIQYPFEWVIKYQAKLESGNSFTLPDLSILRGNIAHTATESILSDIMNDPDFKLTDKLIADRLTAKIREEGLVFMLTEHRFEHAELVRKYIYAIRSLVSLIKDNELIIIGCERDADREIHGLGHVAGTMDLVLGTKNGQMVILDLKWSRSSKKYQLKLEEGRSVQLAIYHCLLGTNPKTGYFMLDNGKLYTGHDLKGTNIVPVTIPKHFDEQGVLQRTLNSIAYRWEELSAGDIELGDNIGVSDLPYFNAIEEKQLVPLEMDKKTKKKYGDSYSGLELFKGSIE